MADDAPTTPESADRVPIGDTSAIALADTAAAGAAAELPFSSTLAAPRVTISALRATIAARLQELSNVKDDGDEARAQSTIALVTAVASAQDARIVDVLPLMQAVTSVLDGRTSTASVSALPAWTCKKPAMSHAVTTATSSAGTSSSIRGTPLRRPRRRRVAGQAASPVDDAGVSEESEGGDDTIVDDTEEAAASTPSAAPSFPLDGQAVSDLAVALVNLLTQDGVLGEATPHECMVFLALCRHWAERLASSDEHLTVFHHVVLMTCIYTRDYRQAWEFITSRPVYQVEKNHVTSAAQAMQYFYAAGMVAVVVRRFDEALELLELSLAVPTSPRAISAIAIEAYRKYILLSLIVDGRIERDPALLIPGARPLRLHAQPYVDVAKAYEAMSTAEGVQRARAEIDKHGEKMRADGNESFVTLLVNALPGHHIRQLAKVYCTASFAEIARSLGTGFTPAGVEAEIVRMISTGSLNAKINSTTGTITFHTSSPTTQNPITAKSQFERELETMQKLHARLEIADRDLALSSRYLKREHGAKSAIGSVAPRFGDMEMLA